MLATPHAPTPAVDLLAIAEENARQLRVQVAALLEEKGTVDARIASAQAQVS